MGKALAFVAVALLATVPAFAQGKRCTADYQCTGAGEACVDGRCSRPSRAAEPDPFSGLPPSRDEGPEKGTLTTDEITEGFKRRIADAGSARTPAGQPPPRPKVQAVVKDGRVMLREIATGKAFSVPEAELSEALRTGEFRLETPDEWNARIDAREAAARREAPAPREEPADVTYAAAARERKEANSTIAIVSEAFGVALGYMIVAFIARRFMTPVYAALVAAALYVVMPFLVGYEGAVRTAGMAVVCFVVHMMFFPAKKPETT